MAVRSDMAEKKGRRTKDKVRKTKEAPGSAGGFVLWHAKRPVYCLRTQTTRNCDNWWRRSFVVTTKEGPGGTVEKESVQCQANLLISDC